LIPSGGAAAVALASDISDYAVSVSDRAQIVVEGLQKRLNSFQVCSHRTPAETRLILYQRSGEDTTLVST
jgi:hypothetical protein